MAVTILGFARGLVLFAASEAFDLYDWLTRRDPDAELKRYLAEHQNVRWYYPDGEPGN